MYVHGACKANVCLVSSSFFFWHLVTKVNFQLRVVGIVCFSLDSCINNAQIFAPWKLVFFFFFLHIRSKAPPVLLILREESLIGFRRDKFPRSVPVINVAVGVYHWLYGFMLAAW